MQYFVSYYRHNVSTGSWAYLMIGRYETLTEATKAFHAQLGNDIGSTTFDSVTVIIVDDLGNLIMSENWKPEAEPATTE